MSPLTGGAGRWNSSWLSVGIGVLNLSERPCAREVHVLSNRNAPRHDNMVDSQMLEPVRLAQIRMGKQTTDGSQRRWITPDWQSKENPSAPDAPPTMVGRMRPARISGSEGAAQPARQRRDDWRHAGYAPYTRRQWDRRPSGHNGHLPPGPNGKRKSDRRGAKAGTTLRLDNRMRIK